MSSSEVLTHWKSLFATDFFRWQRTTAQGNNSLYYRPLGIVENLFDLDGIDYDGRADINMIPRIEVKAVLSDLDLRHRILLAWTCLRGAFPLLACKALYKSEFLAEVIGKRWIDKCFVYEKRREAKELIEASKRHLTFLEDQYPEVEIEDFFIHLANTGRTFDAKETLSRLYVLPFHRNEAGTFTLIPLMVAGHEVADGLTIFRLTNAFIDLLNKSDSDLLKQIEVLCSSETDTVKLLPPPQEALYPIYSKSIARDRWNWAITRVLRHVRKPLPPAFQNPLRRDVPWSSAKRMVEKYQKVLDYTKVPPLNCARVAVTLPARANKNLVRLCKEARISIGSGAFALVAIVMMRMEELRRPGIASWDRLPFIGSFPVNPRPFLTGIPTTGKEASLMLAFSEGVTLPFIPSDLDLIKAFRVLGRSAHRQLRQYQKRQVNPAEESLQGSRSPRELLPALYLSTMERLDARAKPEEKVGFNPQGAYPAKPNPTMATCGISSVGDVSGLIGCGKYDLETGKGDIVADFRELNNIVRPRDGEFLVGTMGMNGKLHFGASCDACAIDPQKAQIWARTFESILDFDLDDNAVGSSKSHNNVPKL